MRLANVNGERTEATPGSKAVCFSCNESVFAKCGPCIISHWCHLPGSTCVHAKSEPETNWHKDWKNTAPERCQEVVIRKSGKTRRADVFTDTQTTVELQHSEISSGEVQDREEFYGRNMFWLFDSDGRKRTISTPPANLWQPKLKQNGFRVWLVEMNDVVPGVGKCRRSNLVDINDYVCRVIPAKWTSGNKFLATIVSADRVRNSIKSACDGAASMLDGFLLDTVADQHKVTEKIRRGPITSTGEYMTEYCPRSGKVFSIPPAVTTDTQLRHSPKHHRKSYKIDPTNPASCRHNSPDDPSF